MRPSRIRAGKKWMKIADILNRNKLETNFRCGYQTADFSGYLCKYPFTLLVTLLQRNGLYELDVQW